MSDRLAFTTNHTDIDAALNCFVNLLPPGCRELFPAIEDALLALGTATDKDAARQHLAKPSSRCKRSWSPPHNPHKGVDHD